MHKVKLINRSISVCYMAIALLPILFISCKKDPVNGKNSLVEFITEQPGENCSNGGILIVEGLDQNGNNSLEADEIETSEYICNGTDGLDGMLSLVEMEKEAPGENCTVGGSKITSGFDINKNNLLDEDEIITTQFVCDGEDGSDGTDGGYDQKLEIRLLFDFGLVLEDYEMTLIHKYHYLYNFDIRKYPGVDSVVFTGFIGVNDNQEESLIELYDVTNSSSITNSQITPRSTTRYRMESGNIFSYLPESPITIGIRGKNVKCIAASILLYRSSNTE